MTIHPSEIPPAEWTFFVYLNRDNDLASFGAEDLKEMEAVGSLAGKLNVIALVDDPGWGSARLLYIDKDGSKQINIDPRSELAHALFKTGPTGEPNMGDPELLRASVQFVKRNFPSNKFALNLWDHGSAWEGVSLDEHPHDHLSIAGGELESALKGIYIDVLAADACLLASLETATVLDKLDVHSLVASEENEPGSGWHYKDLLGRMHNLLNAKPNAGVDAFTATMVESYAAGPSSNKTLSSVRLHDVVYVQNHLDKLSELLVEAGGLRNPAIARAYDESLRFGSIRDQLDLGDFVQKIERTMPSGPLKKAAMYLSAAIQHGALFDTADPVGYDAARGISIYGPRRSPSGTVSIDPGYVGPKAAWRDMKWIDFLKSGGPPLPAGTEIPAWAAPVPMSPISYGATPRSTQGYVPITIRSISPNQGNTVSIVGFMQADRTVRTSTNVDPLNRRIDVFVHMTPTKPEESDHPRTYASIIDLPVRDGDFEPWTVSFRHAESNNHLGSMIWRRGAGSNPSEIL